MQAVGVYIQTLRKSQGLTQKAVAAAADTTTTTIYRYEHGTGEEVEMPLLFKVVAAVKGRGDDLMKLVLADAPTDEYARALAKEARLSADDRALIEPLAISDEETAAFIQAAHDLSTQDKGLMREAQGYINALRARAGQPRVESPPVTSRRQKRAK